MSSRSLRRTLAVSLVALLATACAAREEAKKATEANVARADAYLQLRENVQPYRGPVNVRIRDGIWLGDGGVRSNTGEPLPARFETKNGVTLVSSRPLTITEIAARITEVTGIPVRDAEMATAWMPSDAAHGAGADSAGAPAGDRAPRPPLNLGDPFATGGSDRSSGPQTMDVQWNGSLSGLLNLVASKFDVEWTYRDGAVRFLGPQTRTFTLYALPLETDTTANIQGAVNTGSTTGSTSTNTPNGAATTSADQGTRTKLETNYWKNVDATIKSLLPKGTPYAINKDVGTVTITAKPSILRAVESYVREENRRLGRQVAISVKVLSVTVDSKDIYNVDFSLLLSKVGEGFGLGFKSVTPLAAAGAAQLTGAIISGDTWKGRNLAGINPATGEADVTKGLIQALSDKGLASLVTSSSVTTLNNQPAPISVLAQTNYVNKVMTTISGDTSSTSIETSTINAGFNMNVLPRIFSNGEMILQYHITLSELVKMTNFESGGNTVQLPEIDSRALMQAVKMKSGDTLVLAGFERTRNSVRDQGTGEPTNWFFGGGTSAQNKREMIVVLITPVILDSTKQLEAAR